MSNLDKEKEVLKKYENVVGLDEAGRGCLAGPVVAGGILIKNNFKLLEEYKIIKDSKKLSPKKRLEIYKLLQKDENLEIGIGICSQKTIDKINILQASLLAMEKSVKKLKSSPEFLLIDGKFTLKNINTPQEAIIDGDNKVFLISAASIIAKVYRDKIMNKWHLKYPEYNFLKNKGYGTLEHRQAIKKRGLSPLHRLSFKINLN